MARRKDKPTEATSKATEQTEGLSIPTTHGTEQEHKALRFWERGGTPKAATIAKAIRDRIAGNPTDLKDHEVLNAITFGAMSEDGQSEQIETPIDFKDPPQSPRPASPVRFCGQQFQN